MTKERHILFSGEMIRAILENRKSQTRRVVKPQPPRAEDVRASAGIDYGLFTDETIPDVWRVSGPVWAVRDKMENPPKVPQWRCPYGKPGDRLWVKETWAIGSEGIVFRSDDGWIEHEPDCKELLDGGKWKSPLYMPKAAARIWLEIVSVRVERVQDISEEDAKEEGVVPDQFGIGNIRAAMKEPHGYQFAILWDSINAKKPGRDWASNPFVWVIEFKRL